VVLVIPAKGRTLRRNPSSAWATGLNDGLSLTPNRHNAMKQPCVYILANKRNGTLYIGVTSDLIQRVWQHREGLAEGFTSKYNIKILVWYELHGSMPEAIAREKAIKEWRRRWKIELVAAMNPEWQDLYPALL